MKSRRSAVRSQENSLPTLKFQRQALTSFAGLVVFQQFFALLNLKARLRACFRGQESGKIFSRATLFLQLIVHILLGFRELRDCRAYQDDPMVRRLLGLRRLPDVATLSRMLNAADATSVNHLRRLLREMLLARLVQLRPARLTLDFDGSVQSTRRRAEGTAVGYNKKRKGARSYYPLFCTVAQTHQVLDFLHRSGNVHDSRGAQDFVEACIQAVREVLPTIVIEVRMDSAFFSDSMVSTLRAAGVEFTISVPFERLTQLKKMIESRTYWHPLNADVAYFEAAWKPKTWDHRERFLFIRKRALRQQKGAVQLDLFVPYETGYDFKVIVTNKSATAGHVVAFHEGRGAQEDIFGQLKAQCQMDYVPVRRRLGNQLYLLASLFAHNLVRELQMTTEPQCRGTTTHRTAWWAFTKLDTLRCTLLHRAGRLTRPHGVLTLTLNANEFVRRELSRILQSLANYRSAA
jgi:hypothetical protein